MRRVSSPLSGVLLLGLVRKVGHKTYHAGSVCSVGLRHDLADAAISRQANASGHTGYM